VNSAVSTIVVRGATSAYCATHLSPLPLLFCSLDRLVFVSVKLLCFPLSFFFFSVFSSPTVYCAARRCLCPLPFSWWCMQSFSPSALSTKTVTLTCCSGGLAALPCCFCLRKDCYFSSAYIFLFLISAHFSSALLWLGILCQPFSFFDSPPAATACPLVPVMSRQHDGRC